MASLAALPASDTACALQLPYFSQTSLGISLVMCLSYELQSRFPVTRFTYFCVLGLCAVTATSVQTDSVLLFYMLKTEKCLRYNKTEKQGEHDYFQTILKIKSSLTDMGFLFWFDFSFFLLKSYLVWGYMSVGKVRTYVQSLAPVKSQASWCLPVILELWMQKPVNSWPQ